MDWADCELVEVVPGKVSGVPLLKHSRVPAQTVLESFELGETADGIAYSDSLEPDDVRGVLAFANAHGLAAHVVEIASAVDGLRSREYKRIECAPQAPHWRRSLGP